MKKVYSFFTLLIIALSPFTSRSQMTVQANATAAAMANMLVGGGVLILNPTMNCHDSGKGIFRGPSTVGFDSGVVLTCGRANTIPGPGNEGVNGLAATTAATSWSRPGDPTLQTLTSLTLHDACVLEFDFRPTGDTVKFDYVWGSEEYTNYTCSGSYNDVFGFFISGPGYGSPTNIAKVPGTNIPVCINSINCGPTGFNPLSNCTMLGPGSPFCAYYVNNSTGTSVVYDGLSTKLTAIATVTPCDTYHLKMGVADATDWTLDSGVFLKAGSLSSTALHVTPIGTNPLDTAVGSQYCVRGCIPGKFVLTKGTPAATATSIKFILGGTAVNGSDYSPVADSVVIPAGGTTGTVYIYGIPKTPPVGPKTVKIFILANTSCGGSASIVDSAQILILDSFAVKINTTDTAICLGQNIQISASADPTLKVWWVSSPAGSLNNDSLLNPIATPSVNTTYTIYAVDPGPGCLPSRDILNVTVIPPPTLFVGDPIKKTCVGRNPPLPIEVTAYPTASYYTYSWTASPASALSWLTPASGANPSIAPTSTNGSSTIDTGNVTYTVTVGISAVAAGCTASQTFSVHILPDDYTIWSARDTDVCYPAPSCPVFTEGCSEFEYVWTSDYGVSDAHSHSPSIQPPGGAVGVQSTVYTLTATSLPGCAPMVKEIKYNVYRPDVNILTGNLLGKKDTTICPTLPVTIKIDTASGTPNTITWSPTTGLTNFEGTQPDFFSLDTGDHTYWVTITDGPGCTDSDKVTIRVSPPVKITASPHTIGYDSVLISLGEQFQLNCSLLSNDPVFYYWRPNDGSLNDPNINNPVAKPSETTMYTVYAMNLWGCRDTANIKIIVDPGTDEFVPSAFTPNGDGLNDIFRINLKFQKLVDFRVFNRWGQLVFENTSSDSKKGWDGTVNGVLQDMGVYHYSIMVQKPSGEKKLYNGDVTLIR